MRTRVTQTVWSEATDLSTDRAHHQPRAPSAGGARRPRSALAPRSPASSDVVHAWESDVVVLERALQAEAHEVAHQRARMLDVALALGEEEPDLSSRGPRAHHALLERRGLVFVARLAHELLVLEFEGRRRIAQLRERRLKEPFAPLTGVEIGELHRAPREERDLGAALLRLAHDPQRLFHRLVVHEVRRVPELALPELLKRRDDVVRQRSEEHTLNSSHSQISYAVFCLKKKKKKKTSILNYITNHI